MKNKELTLKHFEVFMSVPTYGTHGWEYFFMDGSHYLAVANTCSDTTSNIDSIIYKWNGKTFVEFQAIPTQKAIHWKFFSIDTDHYLAVVNHSDGTHHNIDSIIYKWDGSQFVKFQAIPTLGAYHWTFFVMGKNHYLAVSNLCEDIHKDTNKQFCKRGTYNTTSVIYKWNGTQFEPFQTIPTQGATVFEFFSIGTDNFLAVANFSDDETHNINSVIYKWDDANNQFSEYQNIPSHGACDWEFFTIEGKHYLAIANWFNDKTSKLNSTIYMWDGSQFVKFQNIPTSGAHYWEFFTIGEAHYLNLANYHYHDTIKNIENFNVVSKIYKWDGTQFVEFQSYPTSGALYGAVFNIDDDYYMATANFKDSSTYMVYSHIYKAVLIRN